MNISFTTKNEKNEHNVFLNLKIIFELGKGTIFFNPKTIL